MATSLPSLRATIRARFEQNTVGFIAKDELDGYIVASTQELYGLVLQQDPDAFTTSVPLTLASGNTCPLPSDFGQSRQVQVQVSGCYYRIKPFSFAEKDHYQVYNQALGYSAPLGLKYRIFQNTVYFVPEISAAPNTFALWYTPKCPIPQEGLYGYATIQSLQFTATAIGPSSVTVTITGGATVGNEVVSVSGNNITIQIASNLSSILQVYNKYIATPAATALASITATSSTSALLQTQATTPLSGGQIAIDVDALGIYDGWVEYVIVDCGIKIRDKQQLDVSTLQKQKQDLRDRILRLAEDRDTEGYVSLDTRGW